MYIGTYHKYMGAYLCRVSMYTYIETCYTLTVRWRRGPFFGRPRYRKEGETMPEEKAKRANSDAQKKAVKKYLGSLDEIKIRAPKGSKDNIRKYAEAAGVSVNQYILDAIQMRMAAESSEE